MENKKSLVKAKNNAELALSAQSLKGKQSVRATFRLPDPIIDLLGAVASQLGLKQKTLFDQLVEDSAVLDQIAAKVNEYKRQNLTRRQKTFVMSRKSLLSLDAVAKEYDVPRDVLVEVSILRLQPVVQSEQAKHRKRKILLKDMMAYLSHGKKLLAVTEELLGSDDQVAERVRELVDLSEKVVMEVNELIDKGKELEEL